MPQSITPAYLNRQLSLDPRLSATRIIALRNQQLGLATRGQESLPRLQSPQAAAGARTAIESIRNQFWTLPSEELNRQLSGIDLRPYPELANVVDQLQQAAAVRAEFPRLEQRLHGDLGLFHCVKQSVTMPPRDAAGMKESVMRALLNGDNIKSYKTTAKIIKEEFPQIYMLQHEWFDDILKSKRLSRDTNARGQEFTLGAPGWIFALLLILLMRGCMNLLP